MSLQTTVNMQQQTDDPGSPVDSSPAEDNGLPSVTPLAQITHSHADPHPFRPLGIHIDTCDLGLQVPWLTWTLLREHLVEHRNSITDNKPHPITIGNRDCLLWPRGRHRYPFHLSSTAEHLYIADTPDPLHYPNVIASLSARSLTCDGLDASTEHLASFIRDLGGSSQWLSFPPYRPEGVSAWDPTLQRLDLAADFIVPEPITKAHLDDHAVTRARKRHFHEVSGKSTGFDVGAGDVRLRVYNKSLQVDEKDIHWFWGHYGIEPRPDVWRIEFQLRRQALLQYGITDLSVLPQQLRGLWRDLTTKWFSLREPDGSNTTRRPFTPFWQAVVDCADLLGGPAAQVRRQRRTWSPARPGWYVSRMKSALLGYAAASGITDRRQATMAFARAMANRYDDSSWTEAVKARQIKLELSSGHHTTAPQAPGEEGSPGVPAGPVAARANEDAVEAALCVTPDSEATNAA